MIMPAGSPSNSSGAASASRSPPADPGDVFGASRPSPMLIRAATHASRTSRARLAPSPGSVWVPSGQGLPCTTRTSPLQAMVPVSMSHPPDALVAVRAAARASATLRALPVASAPSARHGPVDWATRARTISAGRPRESAYSAAAAASSSRPEAAAAPSKPDVVDPFRATSLTWETPSVTGDPPSTPPSIAGVTIAITAATTAVRRADRRVLLLFIGPPPSAAPWLFSLILFPVRDRSGGTGTPFGRRVRVRTGTRGALIAEGEKPRGKRHTPPRP